jgi:hypothetical protein
MVGMSSKQDQSVPGRTGRDTAMANLKNEVAQSVYAMYEALTVFGDTRSLATPIGSAASDFNDVLARARAAFPFADTLRDINLLDPQDAVVVLMCRLSVVKGAIDGQFLRRSQRPLFPRPGKPKIVRLPRGAEQHLPVGSAPPSEDDVPDLTGVTVLLAERPGLVRELLRIGLTRCGAIVKPADETDDALHKIASRRPHVLVFDIGLEDDGVPLAVAAQARALPMIALATREVDPYLEKILSTYNARLLRTLDQPTLARAIRTALIDS